MFKYIKENPFKAIGGILTIITTLSTGGYGVYSKSSAYFENFATRVYVKEQITDLSLEVLGVAIMRYEDDLMVIDFLIASGKDDAMDRATKENIERRLQDLKNKRVRLENGTHDENPD